MLKEISHNSNLIKKINYYDCTKLCKEIRKKIVLTTSKNGGHLASSLGCVELSVALMRVFDFPSDKIIWDVGHQAYAYKLLTDRFDRFDTLRKENGISGFSHKEESPYESFISGHASTSLAIAYGIKNALDLNGEFDKNVVAVFGDGSLTGGEIYEGINNIGKSKKHIIAILNDNNMSISNNDGAISNYLSAIRSNTMYYEIKDKVKKDIKTIPIVGEDINEVFSSIKSAVKRMVYPQNVVENFGFKYFGPVDGHDIKALENVLFQAKNYDGPSLVHIKTIKGKGYKPAELNPELFHGIGIFDPIDGSTLNNATSFSLEFGKELVKIAERDDDILAITAAMESGTGLKEFANRYKESGRFFDVGIAEEFGMTFSAALASNGKKPVYAIYSTFLQRCYDQIIHDVSIEKEHVVIAIDRAGIVGEDGETHQGIYDCAFLSTVPDITVFSPCNYIELKEMLNKAVYDVKGPVAIRYPRGSESPIVSNYPYNGMPFDIYGNINSDVLIVTYGRLFSEAVKAHSCGRHDFCILKLNQIVPIDREAIQFAHNFSCIHFFEEAMKFGGIGQNFLAKVTSDGYIGKAKIHAISEAIPQSNVKDALNKLGLDSEGILKVLDEEKA